MAAAVHYLAPALLGREAADIGGALAAMDGRMYGNHGAKAAVEIALHDLAGKAANKPVHALLGGKRRSRMALLGVVGGGDFDGDVKDVATKKADGVTAYKIKVGVDTPQKDAARTRAICQALGSGLLISADANQGYTVAQAIDYVRAVQGCGLDFFEQPVMAHDLAGMAEVAAAAGAIAIGADEGIHSRDDISRHHEMMAARGVSLKAIKLGGLRALTEAGRLCDRLGMSVNVSCKTGESSIACAAALHAAAVMPNIAWALTLTHTGACRRRHRAADPDRARACREPGAAGAGRGCRRGFGAGSPGGSHRARICVSRHSGTARSAGPGIQGATRGISRMALDSGFAASGRAPE